ncbi:hypothetical protein ACIROD_25155 [Peribacillus sp. NPDC101481]|uniref:hypothetical protein n=1 Tax=Peribacillus sp. NPDC101481 TaxID=3364403 RepID=UPI0037F49711
MRLRNRILKIEKVLPPAAKQGSELQEQGRVIEWLVQNSKEFMECVRQLFRLQCKVGQSIENWERWKEPYREQADIYSNRINELIKQHTAQIWDISEA